MKFTYSFFVYLISISSLFSQTPYESALGNEFKTDSYTSINTIIGYENNITFVLRCGDGCMIEKVDSEMNILKSTKLKSTFNKDDLDFEEVFMIQGNLFFFTSFKDKKSKRKRLFYQSIDKSTLLIKGEPNEIASIDYDKGSKKNSGNFEFNFSKDKSKILVSYNFPYLKKERESFGLKVFDQNLKEIWTKEIELPFADELFVLSDKLIDEEGNVYILGKHYRTNEKLYKDRTFRVLKYVASDDYETEFMFNLPKNYITDQELILKENGNIQLVGFYKTPGSYNYYIMGTFSIELDGSTKEVLSIKEVDFSKETIYSNLKESSVKKMEKQLEKGNSIGLANYYLKKVVKRNDGGLFLVGQQFFKHQKQQTQGSGTVFNDFYEYDDILVVSISPKGKTEWSRVIPKSQHTMNNNNYSSLNEGYINNNIVLVYNDHQDNMSNFEPGHNAIFDHKDKLDAITVCVTISLDGKVNKTQIYSYKDDGLMYYPLYSAGQLYTEYILFYSKRNKKERLGKVLIQ